MWVFEEIILGKKLTTIINTEHENVKYLPGIKLPDNIIAESDIKKATQGATVLIFVLPHQFVASVCSQLKGLVTNNCKAITLIKGVDIQQDRVVLFSEKIKEILGISSCCALMGANIGHEVAAEQFCETTIGYDVEANGRLFQELFHMSFFRVSMQPDVAGVEICGALKNIVAIAAGFCDGLGLGTNTKAAVIRIGLMEMIKFAKTFFNNVKSETFFESCAIGDLITTCFGGRNRKIAEAFIKTGKTFEELEKELLNGQKLQGVSTTAEVNTLLRNKQLTQEFPLFTVIFKICFEGLSPQDMFDHL